MLVATKKKIPICSSGIYAVWEWERPARRGDPIVAGLGGFGVSKDILVFSREEVEYWRDSLNHVLARALREGRVFYERS